MFTIEQMRQTLETVHSLDEPKLNSETVELLGKFVDYLQGLGVNQQLQFDPPDIEKNFHHLITVKRINETEYQYSSYPILS